MGGGRPMVGVEHATEMRKMPAIAHAESAAVSDSDGREEYDDV